METFSKRLRELREQRRLSRKVASELCGFYEHAFRRYERGESIPSPEALSIMADELGVSMDHLLCRAEK